MMDGSQVEESRMVHETDQISRRPRGRNRPGRGRLGALVLAAALATGGCAGAGTGSAANGAGFPSESITMVVSLPAGSAPDAAFRKLASIAEKQIGQSIVIVNKPGGAGTVGLADVATAKPDGHTIGGSGSGALTLQPKLTQTAYQGPADFTHLVQIYQAPMVLFTRTDSGLGNVEDLVARARANPGTVRIGIAGEHDVLDIEGNLLARAAGVQMPTVPMGAGKQVLGVLNNTVEVGIAQPLLVKPHVDSGALRILGVFGESVPAGVSAPLLADSGYPIAEVPDLNLVAPAGLAAPTRDRLVEVFTAAVRSPEFQEFAANGMLVAEPVGADELTAKLDADAARFARYIEEFGWS